LLRLSWLAFWRLQSSLRWSSGLVAKPMTPLILKRASVSRSPGQWRDDDYDVLEKGVVVSRIFKVWVAPPDRPVRQETIALRDFGPAYDGFGSKAVLRPSGLPESRHR
jgi:hypothetical protein